MAELPSVFIASSSEGKDVAEAIAQNINEVCEYRIWSDGFFEPGKFYLETLEELPKYDFAIMTLTNDDKMIVRGTDYNSPRDNVVFEMGICIGSLGRSRTFLVLDKDAKLKMPSDLAGLTTGGFRMPTNDLTDLRNTVSSACIDIKNAIRKLGVKNAPVEEDKNCFPKDIKVIENVGSVLQNQVSPIIQSIISSGENLAVKNFGLDLQNVMTWMKDCVQAGQFDGATVSFQCLILNPESPYLKPLIDGDSNVASDSVTFSIGSAKKFADSKTLSRFSLEMRQYDMPPVAHGFIINDTHVFLSFTEVKDGKLIGGIKPYIYLNKQQSDSSSIALNYFTFFKSWFDAYWNISNTVVNVAK